jgi:hypothetical protein
VTSRSLATDECAGSLPDGLHAEAPPAPPRCDRHSRAGPVGTELVNSGDHDVCLATATVVLMSEIGQTGPGPGWFPDPWQLSGIRWWAGTAWTEHTAPKPSRPIALRWLRFLFGIGAAVFMAVAIGLITLGIVIHPAPFIVTPVTATAQSSLTVRQCQRGQPLDIVYPWHGSSVSVKYYNEPCTRRYSAGDELQLFAGSDSPADLGPTQTWLLEPDTHDPFAIIGPTQVRSTLITFGLFALVPGLALSIAYIGIRRAGRQPRRNGSV